MQLLLPKTASKLHNKEYLAERIESYSHLDTEGFIVWHVHQFLTHNYLFLPGCVCVLCCLGSIHADNIEKKKKKSNSKKRCMCVSERSGHFTMLFSTCLKPWKKDKITRPAVSWLLPHNWTLALPWSIVTQDLRETPLGGYRRACIWLARGGVGRPGWAGWKRITRK